MHILHLDAGRSLRGGQHQLLHLLRSLQARGHESDLLAPVSSPLFEHARLINVPAEPLSWRAVRALCGEYDLIHCHDARSHTLAALWSTVPFVVSRRVVFPVKKGYVNRWKYARAARYLAISNAVKEQLLAAGISGALISIVPDGTPIPAALSTRDGAVVAIDSEDPRKGGAILRSTGLDIHFSSNLAADLLHARAFVYITDTEGLGSAALLAMANGVPVVASRVGGLPEIVIHEETGLLVDNQPGAITGAVARVLNDPGLSARLAANGRCLVEQRFTIDQMADATLDAYRMVLS